MNDQFLRFRVDVSEIADVLNRTREEIESRVTSGVESLSIAAHAYITNLANTTFASADFKRQYYLGIGKYGKDASGHSTADPRIDQTIKNLRWIKVSDGLWVVELDERARWLEEGRCVVYGTSPDHTPKVLTPSGLKSITKIQIGDLVLNQFGKWTAVSHIYDKKLTEESTLRMDVIETCRYCPENPKRSKRRYIEYVMYTCNACGHMMKQKKFHQKSHDKKQCEKCLINKKIVKLRFNIGKTSDRTLLLTANHRVLTNEGWLEAQYLNPTIHKIFVPSFCLCQNCGNPAKMHKKFCSTSCASSFNQRELVKVGKHHAQTSTFAAKRYKLLLARNAVGISLSEERAAAHIESLGYKVGFYGEKGEFDVIRQYPIKKDKGYFYSDFYVPALKLSLEIDGKKWHNFEKDTRRDNHLKHLGIDTIRFASWRVITGKFKREIASILANHEDRIDLVPISFKKEIIQPSKYTGLTRRWDITVEEGNSFVCEGIVIHNSETFMGEWLLKPGAKGVKRSKDGSLFRSIPFKETENGKAAKGAQPQLAQIVQDFAKFHKVNLRQIEKDNHGEAKIGFIQKLDIRPHDAPGYAPGVLFSKPRTDEDAAKSGLKPHEGIFKLEGAAVFQNVYHQGKRVSNPFEARRLLKSKKGKVKKETVVFRTISSKHKAEGRWMYPKVEPANFFQQTQNWAEQQWATVVLPAIERSLSTE